MQDARPASSGDAEALEPDTYDADAPQGLAWSWELDFDALQAALDAPAPWNRPRPVADGCSAAGSNVTSCDTTGGADGGAVIDSAEEEDQEALLDAMLASDRPRELSTAVVAGRIAESLPAGPGLAAWLANAQAEELEEGALVGVASSFRRMASWAQAGELAAVAQIASRAAAREPKIGVDGEGRPARIPASACSQVSLGLVMTACTASWWTDLAVTLCWRLGQTGAALAQGRIDLSRARLIAEATSLLSDDAARAVEGRVLPGAGALTTGQLRTALRRAVIAVDPEGAERRRQEAERRAKVSLYGDDEGTATLSGSGLPVIQASAAMARITAMARALKASGAVGGMDLHRAQVFIGLLLGTLPYIAPAQGAPPDAPPPPDDGGPGEDEAPDDGGPDSDGSHCPGSRAGRPGAGESPGPRNSGFAAGPHGGGCPDGAASGSRPMSADPPQDTPAPTVPWEDPPWPGDQDVPSDEGDPCPDGRPVPAGHDDDQDVDGPPGPAPLWAPLPAVIPPAVTRSRSAQAWTSWPPPGTGRPPPGTGRPPPGTGRPPPGLLDVALPWSVLAGLSLEPGHLGRIGPVTAAQARRLAEAACADPGAMWRIIVTSPAGQALAVTRVPRRTRARDGPGSHQHDQPPPGSCLVGRVTLTISQDTLTRLQSDRQSYGPADGIVTTALRAAGRAAARAQEQALADAAAGGCAHASQSQAYRPPPRLQEFVTARDLTCRFPTCRQPAWRGDLDHTTPWPCGRTCRCNLGGLCRTHHQLKQLQDWTLSQLSPGTFEWITPTGRRYTATPDTHPI